MQIINKIQSKGEYSLQALNTTTDSFKIEEFVISPNDQYIAIVIQQIKLIQYSTYLVELIEIKSLLKFTINQQLFYIHCLCLQFSNDSNYLIYHYIKQLIITNIQTKQVTALNDVDKFYQITKENNIFLQKKNCIQVYSIEKMTYITICNVQYNFFSLQNNESQLFWKFQFSQYFILFRKDLNKDIQKHKFLQQIFSHKFNIFKNTLVISQFPLKQQYFIQLRGLRNLKLLRCIISNQEYENNLIQDTTNVYICKAIFNSQNQVDYFSRFNLITGSIKFMKFKISKPEQRAYFTNSILVDIDEQCEKLRFFFFDE